MALEKMSVTGYTDSMFTELVGKTTEGFVNPFQVFINPEKYSRSYRIDYRDGQAQGSNGPSPVFDKVTSDSVNFELVFDGTGVVPIPRPGGGPAAGYTVEKQIAALRKLALTYNGKIHRPNFLMLSWGTLLFKCVLTTLDLTYTLFMPDGTPLRARAAATFIGFSAEPELALEANKSSPDLAHVLTVKAGDTLPLMCRGVYGSDDYYTQVARFNGLTGFRNLAEGTKLQFPPLGAAAR